MVEFPLSEQAISTLSGQTSNLRGNSLFQAAFGPPFPRKIPVSPIFQENKSPGGAGRQKTKNWQSYSPGL